MVHHYYCCYRIKKFLLEQMRFTVSLYNGLVTKKTYKNNRYQIDYFESTTVFFYEKKKYNRKHSLKI
jgi:hypothetical protein